MQQRTFRQFAQGFGAVPAQAVVTIDGDTVFNGAVDTINQPPPPLPNGETTIDNVAWSWQGDTLYQGARAITVAVTGSPVILAMTLANTPYADLSIWGQLSSQKINGLHFPDPFTDVKLNGVSVAAVFDPQQLGQRWWRVEPGSIWSATMNILIWDHQKLTMSEIAEAYSVLTPPA